MTSTSSGLFQVVSETRETQLTSAAAPQGLAATAMVVQHHRVTGAFIRVSAENDGGESFLDHNQPSLHSDTSLNRKLSSSPNPASLPHLSHLFSSRTSCIFLPQTLSCPINVTLLIFWLLQALPCPWPPTLLCP